MSFRSCTWRRTNSHKNIQNAPLSILKFLQTSPGLSLKDFNPQPGNTYKKKSKNSLIHKELMRKRGWGGILAELSVPPAPC